MRNPCVHHERGRLEDHSRAHVCSACRPGLQIASRTYMRMNPRRSRARGAAHHPPASRRRALDDASVRRARVALAGHALPPTAVAHAESRMAGSAAVGRWVEDGRRVDGRSTWSGCQLPAVHTARPAKVFSRARLIGKIYYRRCTSVPAILQRLARLISDLRGRTETTREHAPITSARSCEDAAGNARDTRDSRLAASRGAEMTSYCTPYLQ